MIFCFCNGEGWMSRGNYFDHGPVTDRLTLEYIHNVWKELAFGLVTSRVAFAWRCKANREVNCCQNAGVTRDSCVKMSDYVHCQDQEKQDRTQKSTHKIEQQKHFVAVFSVSFCFFFRVTRCCSPSLWSLAAGQKIPIEVFEIMSRSEVRASLCL